MDKQTTDLAHLPKKKRAKIISIHGGRHFCRRMCVMGLREGQIVEIISRQPLRGPLTISIGSCKMTIGRGMAHRILVEEL
jgi:Fe2+ transport system protein FeoA